MKRMFIPQPYALLLCSGAIGYHVSRYTADQLYDGPYLVCSGRVAKGQRWLLDNLGVAKYNHINTLLKDFPPYYFITGLALAILTFTAGRAVQPYDTEISLKPFYKDRYIHQVNKITLINPFLYQSTTIHRDMENVDQTTTRIKKTDRLQWRGLLYQHAKLSVGV